MVICPVSFNLRNIQLTKSRDTNLLEHLNHFWLLFVTIQYDASLDLPLAHGLFYFLPLILILAYALVFLASRTHNLKYPNNQIQLFCTPQNAKCCEAWYMETRVDSALWILGFDAVTALHKYTFQNTGPYVQCARYIYEEEMILWFLSHFLIGFIILRGLSYIISPLLLRIPYMEWVEQNKRIRALKLDAENGEVVHEKTPFLGSGGGCGEICQCRARNVPENDSFFTYLCK